MDIGGDAPQPMPLWRGLFGDDVSRKKYVHCYGKYSSPLPIITHSAQKNSNRGTGLQQKPTQAATAVGGGASGKSSM